MGAFEGVTSSGAKGLNYIGGGNATVSAPSYSTTMARVFFIADGLTSDGGGSTQTLVVPQGATTFYLSPADARGYAGAPKCFGDNSGQYAVTFNGVR